MLSRMHTEDKQQVLRAESLYRSAAHVCVRRAREESVQIEIHRVKSGRIPHWISRRFRPAGPSNGAARILIRDRHVLRPPSARKSRNAQVPQGIFRAEEVSRTYENV